MRPYYIRKDYDGLIAYPIHYVLFSRFEWYRKLIGGPWQNFEGAWVRMAEDEK